MNEPCMSPQFKHSIAKLLGGRGEDWKMLWDGREGERLIGGERRRGERELEMHNL